MTLHQAGSGVGFNDGNHWLVRPQAPNVTGDSSSQPADAGLQKDMGWPLLFSLKVCPHFLRHNRIAFHHQ